MGGEMIPIIITSLSPDLLPQTRHFLRASRKSQVFHHVSPREWFHPQEEKNRCINIARGRTEALKMALSTSWEHALFLDDDVVPCLCVISRLLKRKLPVVSTWIPAKKGNFIGGRFIRPFVFEPFQTPQADLTETDLVSLGCTLIHREYLEGHEFDPGIDRFCQDRVGNVYHAADSGAFSEMMRKRGIKLYLDGNCICRHEGI